MTTRESLIPLRSPLYNVFLVTPQSYQCCYGPTLLDRWRAMRVVLSNVSQVNSTIKHVDFLEKKQRSKEVSFNRLF